MERPWENVQQVSRGEVQSNQRKNKESFLAGRGSDGICGKIYRPSSTTIRELLSNPEAVPAFLLNTKVEVVKEGTIQWSTRTEC